MATVPDEDLEPLHPSLHDNQDISEREVQMLRLAATALREVLAEPPVAPPIPLLMTLPEAPPGHPASTLNPATGATASGQQNPQRLSGGALAPRSAPVIVTNRRLHIRRKTEPCSLRTSR